jgi:ribosomal protein S18 acetylase RimI-like enzyme
MELAMLVAVRRIRLTDLPMLERFEAHTPRPAGVAERYMERYRAMLETALSKEPGGFLVAEHNQETVGAVVARVTGPHPMNGLSSGRIETLTLSPAHPGQGVGERLLKEAEAYLRSHGCRIISLNLPADAGQAGELYRTAGYRVASWELERELS